jgi:hypothetical protein
MKSYTLRPDTFTLNFNLTLSGAMGMIVMLLSSSPCASVIQKDFPEVRTVEKTSHGSDRHLHSTIAFYNAPYACTSSVVLCGAFILQ